MRRYDHEGLREFWVRVDLHDPDLPPAVAEWAQTQTPYLRDGAHGFGSAPYTLDDQSRLPDAVVAETIARRQARDELITIEDVGERALTPAEITYNQGVLERQRERAASAQAHWETHTPEGALARAAKTALGAALQAAYGHQSGGTARATDGQAEWRISHGSDGSFSITRRTPLTIDRYELGPGDRWYRNRATRVGSTDSWGHAAAVCLDAAELRALQAEIERCSFAV